MARYLIIGGGGMIGQKIANQLEAESKELERPHEVVLFDLAIPQRSSSIFRSIVGSMDDDSVIEALVSERPDVIIQLAAILSGESELDFDKGWRVNCFANWKLLEALRAENIDSEGRYRPVSCLLRPRQYSARRTAVRWRTCEPASLRLRTAPRR